MNATDPIKFPGKSGVIYQYWLLTDPKTASAIKAEGGNYAFVKLLANGSVVPLYFGKADDLRDRIPSHECWPEAKWPAMLTCADARMPRFC